MPQPLAPAGAVPSPHQLSFMFIASPFLSLLLAFFYLSPGQAPNWKTEAQTGDRKPVLPRDRGTSAQREELGSRIRKEKANQHHALLLRPPHPRKMLSAHQLPTALFVGRFSFHSKKEKKNPLQAPKSFLGRSQITLSMGWMFLNFFSSQYISFCCLCYFLGRGMGSKYFEANKRFKNQPLPQGILGRLSSEVP